MTGLLDGKVALVTGGTGGIGRAIAETYAAAGATICIADLARSEPERIAAAIGHGAFGLPIDVTDRRSIGDAVAGAAARAGRLDIVVANAGRFETEPFLDITEASFDRLMAVNARGALMTITTAAKKLIEQGTGGKIVVTASGAGRKGNPHTAAYNASKAAVISLVQSAAQALAADRITVNAIAPGLVGTAMADAVIDEVARDTRQATEAIRAMFVGAVPFGRLGEVADVTGAALFLASPASDYITGQTLNVDGGLFMN